MDIIFDLIKKEEVRQAQQIEMIASENITSQAVMDAVGSVLTNKYAEGYPGRRYYESCEIVDQVENIAIDRLKQLYNCDYANVQPASGSQANQAVFAALLTPGDTFLGMDLACGGHLTHGAKVSTSGKWFNAVHYGVDPVTHIIDYDQVRALAHEHKPKLIIAGGSAYPRIVDFAKFREIADEVGAFLHVDMAHFAGLVAGGAYPSPVPYAHVITSTTHKTLRGPRGAIIISSYEPLFKKLNSAVFPGIQGGPFMNVIAGKAIAFAEAMTDEYKAYAHQIVANAKALADELGKHMPIISGGTDSHLLLANVKEGLGITGKDASAVLNRVNLSCNMNGLPYDPLPFTQTSGIRLGTPAGTTRGMKEDDFRLVANIIVDILTEKITEDEARERVKSITDRMTLPHNHKGDTAHGI